MFLRAIFFHFHQLFASDGENGSYMTVPPAPPATADKQEDAFYTAPDKQEKTFYRGAYLLDQAQPG
jgi:hypothetical protein